MILKCERCGEMITVHSEMEFSEVLLCSCKAERKEECWVCGKETWHDFKGRFKQPIRADVWECTVCGAEEHEDYL